MFGSDDLRGCQQAFFEILSNSIDEAREGHGKVSIRRYEDFLLKSPIADAAFLLISTRMRIVTTGNLSIANFMPAGSIRPI